MKNCKEWLLAFNNLYNNIMSNKAPGLNPYEISCFLTDAEEAVVMGLYNGSFGKSFESEEDIATFLAPLVRQVEMSEVTEGVFKARSDSHIYTLPADADEILVKTLELCYVDAGCKDANGNPIDSQAIVKPLTQDEYWHTIRNPFKRQNANRVLRLTNTSPATVDSEGNLSVSKYSELISDREIKKYIVRYITRPEPIILVDLKVGEQEIYPTIRGKYRAQTCLLDDAIHQAILNEAVRMAKAVWQS